jgi:hypothetical protein
MRRRVLGVASLSVLVSARQTQAQYELPGPSEILIYAAGGLLAFLLLALVFREVFCWYGKVNERLALLKEIRDLLGKEVQRLEREREIRASAPRAEAETSCSKCGARFVGDLRGRFCDHCGSKL